MPPEHPTFKIESHLIDRIGELARAGYPNEICGFLLGREDAEGRVYNVEAVFEVVNREGEEARRRFLVDKDQYAAAEAEAGRKDLRLLGVYHSHPDAPAVPSKTDAEFAFPGWVYWITPVSKGVDGKGRVWLRSGDGLNWSELEV